MAESMKPERALAIIPRSLPDVQQMADVLSKSTLLPDALKGKAPDVVVQILAGQELGLSPMASIRGVHIVQGKPLLSADTMVALVLGSGLCEYFSVVEETAAHVTYETKRNGSPHPQRVTWSDEDTKLAGLSAKDNWRTHKRQMRRARAKAMLARDVYPDVLAGCYDPDETIEPALAESRPVRPSPVNDAIDAEIASPAESVFAQIAEASSHEALRALAEQVKLLPEEQKTEGRKLYEARWVALKPAVEAAS